MRSVPRKSNTHGVSVPTNYIKCLADGGIWSCDVCKGARVGAHKLDEFIYHNITRPVYIMGNNIALAHVRDDDNYIATVEQWKDSNWVPYDDKFIEVVW